MDSLLSNILYLEMATEELNEYIVEVISNIISHLPTNDNDFKIALCICITIGVSILFIAFAVGYCFRQVYKSKLKGQEIKQKFEENKTEAESKKEKAKWEEEQVSRLIQWNHEKEVAQREREWKKQDEKH